MTTFKKTLYLAISFVILVGFQNCGGYYDSLDNNFTKVLPSENESCDSIFEEFKTGFHTTVRNANCQSCHDVGKSASFLPFAAADTTEAYDAFQRHPYSKYIGKVNDNHQSSVINYNSTELASFLEINQETYEAKIESCQADNDDADSESSLSTNKIESDLYDLARVDSDNCGFNDAIKIEVVQAPHSTALPDISTLSWDLGEIDSKFEGVTVKLDITISAPTTFPQGNSPLYACPNLVGYLVGNLRVSSMNKNVNLKNIKVFINDDDKDEYSFWNIEQAFSPGSEEVPFNQTGTSLVSYSMDGVSMKADNKWHLFIESIQIEK